MTFNLMWKRGHLNITAERPLPPSRGKEFHSYFVTAWTYARS